MIYDMFVRARQVRNRMQLSIVENRRLDGKVVQEHIAGQGSVKVPASVAERVDFRTSLNDRLGKLDDRIGEAERSSIFEDVQAKVPMPTKRQADARALKRFLETYPEWRDQLAPERRANRIAAEAFTSACAAGDIEAFQAAV